MKIKPASIIFSCVFSAVLISIALLYACTCVFGHEYDDGEITEQPTCAKHGVLTYTCSKCGDQYTELIPETEHKFDLGAVTLHPTCEEEGVMTYTCKGCGYQYTKEIKKSEHKRNSEIPAELITEPTCSESGSELCVCELCGGTFEEPIPATGDHKWIAATALCPKTCDLCGITEGGALFDGHWRDEIKNHAQYEFVIDTKAGTYTVNELYDSSTYGNNTKLFKGRITEASGNQITTAGGWILVYNSNDTVSVKDNKTFPAPLKRHSSGTEETRVTADLTSTSKAAGQNKPKTSSASAVKITDLEAFLLAQKIVEDRLKAPSTAKFCKQSEAKIERDPETGDYQVMGYVDAQNGFGAQVRSVFLVTFTPTKNGDNLGYKNATCISQEQ